MAHSRGCAERELQRDVVALKRGMRQLLEDADAASSKHQMVLSAEREKRRDELAMLQQTVHDAKMDAAKARESLCVTKSELKEANGKLEDFRLLVAGQDKQLEKQRERLSEMHKLEAQLREFFSMQGSKGLDAWHKAGAAFPPPILPCRLPAFLCRTSSPLNLSLPSPHSLSLLLPSPHASSSCSPAPFPPLLYFSLPFRGWPPGSGWACRAGQALSSLRRGFAVLLEPLCTTTS